jgi:hypothetical protein
MIAGLAIAPGWPASSGCSMLIGAGPAAAQMRLSGTGFDDGETRHRASSVFGSAATTFCPCCSEQAAW